MSTEHLQQRKFDGRTNPPSMEAMSNAAKVVSHVQKKIFAAIVVLGGSLSLLYAQYRNLESLQEFAYDIARVCGGPSETTAVNKATRSITDDLSPDLEYEVNAGTWALAEDGATDGIEEEREIKMTIQEKSGRLLLEAKFFVYHAKGEKLPKGFGGSNPPINTLDADTNMRLQHAINEYLSNKSDNKKNNLVEEIYLSGKWNSGSDNVIAGLKRNLPAISKKLLYKIGEELREEESKAEGGRETDLSINR